MRKKALLAGLGILVICTGWCFHRRLFQDDEKRIRAIVEEMRVAAEAKNSGALMSHFSSDYKDRDGNNKFILGQIVTRSLAHASELKVTIGDVDVFVTGSRATATVPVTVEAISNGAVYFPFGSADEPERPRLTLQKTATGDWLIVKVENVRENNF